MPHYFHAVQQRLDSTCCVCIRCINVWVLFKTLRIFRERRNSFSLLLWTGVLLVCMTVGCRVQQQGRKKSPLLSCMDPPGNMQMKCEERLPTPDWLTFSIFPWTSWCGSFTAFWLKSFNGHEDSSSCDVLWLIDPTVQPLVKILLIITCGVLEGVSFL